MLNRTKCLLYKVGGWALYAVPMLILFFANHDEYKSDGSFFGFFGFVIMAFLVLAFKKSVIAFFKGKTLLCVSLLLLIFSCLMEYLAGNMILIAAVSAVGSVMQSVMEPVADVYEGYAYIEDGSGRHLNRAPAIPDAQAWREAYGL